MLISVIIFFFSGSEERTSVNFSDTNRPRIVPEGWDLFVLIPGYTESSFRKWVNVSANGKQVFEERVY